MMLVVSLLRVSVCDEEVWKGRAIRSQSKGSRSDEVRKNGVADPTDAYILSFLSFFVFSTEKRPKDQRRR